MIRYLKKLLTRRTPKRPAVEQWSWECVDADCGANGRGIEELVRAEAISHCLIAGHTAKGGVRNV